MLKKSAAIQAAALVSVLVVAALHGQTPVADQLATTEVDSLRTNAATPSNPGPQEYLISPDDVLDVYLVDVPELSRPYRVSPTGTVTLPLLPNALNVVGLTLTQFADLITHELKSRGLVSDAKVTVTVKESRMHSVVITGAVKRPQLYFVLGRTTLLDVLSQAEGLAEDAGSNLNVVRGEMAVKVFEAKKEVTPPVVNIDLQRLLATGESALNIDIYPGDRVIVPTAGIVYVVGAVNRPGGFPLSGSRKQLTVLQAVALAEDLKSTAIRDKTIILRRGPQYAGGQQEIPIKLKEILRGKAEDVSLAANDILFVPDSTGKRALLRGAETILQIGTGIAIMRH